VANVETQPRVKSQEAEAEKRLRKLIAEQTRLERAKEAYLLRAVRRAETALEAVPF